MWKEGGMAKRRCSRGPVVDAKRVLRVLLRSNRECSIGMYLVLLELAAADGVLSCTALERRVRCPGLKNPRQLLSAAAGYGWVLRVVDADGDAGWVLAAAGYAVVAGLLVRLGVSGAASDGVVREAAAGRAVRDVAGQLFLRF